MTLRQFFINPLCLTNHAINIIILLKRQFYNSDLLLINNKLSTPRPMCRKVSGGVIFFCGTSHAC